MEMFDRTIKPALLIAASYGLWLGVLAVRRMRGKESTLLRFHIEHVRGFPHGASTSENKDRSVFRRKAGYFPRDGYMFVSVKDHLHAMGVTETDEFLRIRQAVHLFIGES
jgi:hypothetical protein